MKSKAPWAILQDYFAGLFFRAVILALSYDLTVHIFPAINTITLGTNQKSIHTHPVFERLYLALRGFINTLYKKNQVNIFKFLQAQQNRI